MWNTIKSIIKSALIYLSDYRRDLKYTTLRCGNNDKERLLSSLVVAAHTIEKGLTMPNKHIPFGEAKAKEILVGCCTYVESGYDTTDSRFVDVVGIIGEYKKVLQEGNVFPVNLDSFFSVLESTVLLPEELSQHYFVKCNEYFLWSDAKFDLFSNSRHSCRNLSGHVGEEILQRAISLSMNAPSTCNRQSHRVHLLQSSKAINVILSIHGGCRGFGEFADQFILITSDLRCWSSGPLRNGPYVDGGIYLMNLLYCLHYEKIAACTLNLYLDNARDRRIHQELEIPKHEVLIALIAIGIPPENFDLTRSHRRNSSEVITRH